MLNQLYKLPRFLLVSLLIGFGVFFILINDPPHTFCDTQIDDFKKHQQGLLYDNPNDFRNVKSSLKRNKNLCERENAPGACYDYFFYLRKLLKNIDALSDKCAPMIYKSADIRNAFSEALILITALAWDPETLKGSTNKYKWLTRPDLILFCSLKNRFKNYYGENSYQMLEKKILSLLPVENKVYPQILRKSSLLSEPCPL